MERGKSTEVVDDAEMGARREMSECVCGRVPAVHVEIRPVDKHCQSGHIDRPSPASVAEALVADQERGVDADEHEEGAAEQALERGRVPDVGQDPVLAPALGDEVQERVDVGEG